MSAVETKSRMRIKKLRETLEITENYEKTKSEKAKLCDMMLEIYTNNEIDFAKKAELLFLLLSKVSRGGLV